MAPTGCFLWPFRTLPGRASRYLFNTSSTPRFQSRIAALPRITGVAIFLLISLFIVHRNAATYKRIFHGFNGLKVERPKGIPK